MQSKHRQHLGETFGCLVCLLLVGYPPFFTLLPLVVVLVGSACLNCLLGFGENTYSDGWIMDRGKSVTFWCVGLLAVIACLIQCLMDMQFFCLCAWLMDGWMDGWTDGRTDGRMDGWMLCKSRREGMRGRAQRYGMGGFGCFVCWLLGGFVGLAALLIGRLVGTPLMDAWMDGCCVNGEGAAPPLQCKPSLPPTGFLVPTALEENTELCGLVAWLVGCLVGLLAWPRCCLVGWLVGTPLMDAWMDGCCVNGEGAAPPLQCKPSLPRTGFLVPTARCLTFRRRPGQFPAVPVVPDSLYAVSGGFRRASNKKLLG